MNRKGQDKPKHGRTRRYGFILCAVFVVAAAPVALTEFFLSFTSGPWPYRELRPQRKYDAGKIENRQRPVTADIDDRPILDNEWGLRDYQRTIVKPPDITRVLMIGDSFLEGGFCRFPLSVLVENNLIRENVTNIEVINLGVSGTKPMEYYFRLRDFGPLLSADVVYLFFYSGNDFRPEGKTYSPRDESPFSRFIAMRPIPSMLGSIAPRLTSLLAKSYDDIIVKNRLFVPHNEFAILNGYASLPYEDGIAKLAEYVHKVYYPELDRSELLRIFAKGGESLWAELRERDEDREYLQGWALNNLVKWERKTSFPHDEKEAVEFIDEREIESAQSWLEAIHRFCRESGIILRVFLVPVGSVDPDLNQFYNPWPGYYSFNHICDAKHSRLAERLRTSTIQFADLRPPLQGTAGTYRKIDMHWTEKGHRIVADLVTRIIVDDSQGAPPPTMSVSNNP